MQRNFKRRHKNKSDIPENKGFSLLELVIAIAIFSFGSFAMGTILIDSNVGTSVSIERTKALLYAREGIEAMRSIRDDDWNALSVLTDGNYGFGINASSTWVLNGVADSIDDKFIRTVNISTNPNALFTKNISVTVDWPLASGKLATTTLSTIISNWISVENLPSQITTDGLVSYWSFDDSLSGTAADNFGTNPGTVYGATSTTGVRSYGYDFNGSGNYIDASSLVVGANDTITLSFWGKPQAISDSQSVGIMIGSGYGFGWDDTGDRWWVLKPGVGDYYGGSSNSPVNEWSHFTAVVSSSTTSVFMAGLPENTIDQGHAGGAVLLGKRNTDAQYWKGSLDQVRIYNRALTASEINVIYEEEKP